MKAFLPLALLTLATTGSCYVWTSTTHRSYIGIGWTSAEFPAQAERRKQVALDLRADEILDLATSLGSVEVRTTEGDPSLEATFAIRGRTQAEADEAVDSYEIRRERTDRGLAVTIEGEPIVIREGRDTTRLQPGIEIVVHVPRSTGLDVRTGSGTIHASGPFRESRVESQHGKVHIDSVVGDVWARSGSGGVVVRNVREGDVTARSGHGSIRVDRVERGSVTTKTGSGSIQLSRIDGDVHANSAYGTVRAERLRGSAELLSSSGNIEASDLEAEAITCRTSYGRIEIREATARETTAKTSSGRIRMRGIAGSIDVHSDYGSVRVEGELDDVRASTNSGSLEVATTKSGRSRSIDLSSRYGSVTFRGPRELAADIDAESNYGGISCDYDVAITGKKQKKRLRGRIRGGGAKVRISSMNGSISIRRVH